MKVFHTVLSCKWFLIYAEAAYQGGQRTQQEQETTLNKTNCEVNGTTEDNNPKRSTCSCSPNVDITFY